jgi:hypothetical protein
MPAGEKSKAANEAVAWQKGTKFYRGSAGKSFSGIRGIDGQFGNFAIAVKGGREASRLDLGSERSYMEKSGSSEVAQMVIFDEVVNHLKRIDTCVAQFLIKPSAIRVCGKNLRAIPTPSDVLALKSQQFHCGKIPLILQKARVNPRDWPSFGVHRSSPATARRSLFIMTPVGRHCNPSYSLSVSWPKAPQATAFFRLLTTPCFA